jgi:hypothetical protein
MLLELVGFTAFSLPVLQSVSVISYSQMKQPTYQEHRRFCEVDGWKPTAAKPGRTAGKHEVWTKLLPNGELLRTQISHGRGEYRNRDFWATIRNEQLRVSEAEFWVVVNDGTAPVRAWAYPPMPKGEPIEFWLVKNLRELVGLREGVIAAMTPGQAQETWDYWRSQPEPGEAPGEALDED